MAKTRVGINGLGRIGRNFFRASLQRDADFELVAFNDLGDVPTMAHLLAYDSLLGPLEGGATVEAGSIKAAGHELRGLAERDPAGLPWGDLAGRTWRLHDRLGNAVYDRDGGDLSARGLYLDLPARGYHAFDVEG